MFVKSLLKSVWVVALVFAFATQSNAADAINTGWVGNVAIKGYDPVAYFKQNKAVEGSKEYEAQWMGATWRFSSAANLQTFQQEPERFAPQYGGYCAFAVAKDSLAGIDPEQFTIVDDKLYLNYSAKIQKQWLADRDAFIEKADTNWPGVLD